MLGLSAAPATSHPAFSPFPVRTGAERPTVVVGLGATGLSCARYLAARGEAIAVVDSRAEPPGLEALQAELPDVVLHLGDLDESLILAAKTLVVSPGISLAQPVLVRAAERGVSILGDIELFARDVAGPVAAVTGSNGKSTVTTLIGDMARADGRRTRVGGNLGPPALDLLEGAPADLYALELSSFQLETTASLRPAVAAILNLSPDHLDRYPDFDAYVSAKRRILEHCETMVLNLDDPRVAAMAEPDRPCIGFTLARPPQAGEFGLLARHGGAWLARGTEPLLPVSALKTSGRYNVANALAALAMGQALGLSDSAMRYVLRGFTGLPHRCQTVATVAGVTWYNDSKATNVGAAVAAIQGLQGQGRLVLIAGGDGKGADFAPLADAAREVLRGAVLLGQDAARLETVLAPVTTVVQVDDMEQAVTAAARLAEPGDRVLLAPACASWDMYRDYQVRGDAFVAAVEKIR